MTSTQVIAAPRSSGRPLVTPARVGVVVAVALVVAAVLFVRSGSTAPAPAAPVAPATTSHLFADGFESGDLSVWTAARSGGDGAVTVEGTTVHSGRFAAELNETATPGSFAYVRQTLPAAESGFTVQGAFRVASEGATGASGATLLRLFDPNFGRELTLYRQNGSGRLWVQHDNAYTWTGVAMPLNTWRTIGLHVGPTVAGHNDLTVSYDGSRAWTFGAASIGGSGVSVVQIGNEVPRQAADEFVDDVAITGTAPARS